MKKLICFALLCLVATSFSQPASRSAFFVANEGQWPGEFAFRYDGGGGSWFVTKDGLTIDLKRYEVSPQTGFGGTEGGYSNRDPFREREHEPRSVKGHVLKVNLIGAYAHHFAVAAHGSANEILDAPLPQTTVGVQNDRVVFSAEQGLSGSGSLPESFSAEPCVPARPELIGADKLASYSNYFLGQDKSKWRSRVGHYRTVVAKEVWPGIDVEYRAEPQGVEMVFLVQPGADINKIQVEYEGLDAPLSIDSKGNLILKTSLGNLIEKAPFAYQIENRRQREVPVHYELTTNSYRFVTDGYDHSRELVIDPLIYSSYFGGDEWDAFYDSDLDVDGNLILAGKTSSSNLPVTPGAYQAERHSWGDVMIAKFNASGTDLLFCTYLGGNGSDNVQCCKVIDDGTICLAGNIESSQGDTWPLTTNAIDSVFGGNYEAFLSCLSDDGTQLLFSSYLGGDNFDLLFDMEKDTFNYIYLTGGSLSNDFPTTSDALFADTSGTVVLRFNPANYELLYSTIIPGHLSCGRSISTLHEGDVWISGESPNGGVPLTQDAYMDTLLDGEGYFFMHLNLNQPQIIYSSYFPAKQGTIIQQALSDSLILLYGYTNSQFIPVTENAFDPTPPHGFIGKLYFCKLRLPSIVEYATYFGTLWYWSSLEDLIVDNDESIVFTGRTQSNYFPTTPNAFDSTFNSIDSTVFSDMFLSRLSADLSHLDYSTYIGGTYGDDSYSLTQTSNGSVWLAGVSQGWGFPITNDAYQPEVNGWEEACFLHFEVPNSTPVSPYRVQIPFEFSMSVFPNPFNPSTTISFTLPRQAQTSLEVFNVLGQVVYSVDLGQLPAGEYRHHLNAASLPSGTYVTKLDAGETQKASRMMLLR